MNIRDSYLCIFFILYILYKPLCKKYILLRVLEMFIFVWKFINFVSDYYNIDFFLKINISINSTVAIAN